MENDAEIEIDLRRYYDIFHRRWQWIVGVAIVVALATFGWSILQSPTYEAVALIAITKPQYTLNFDPRIATVADTIQTFKAYPELAKSEELLQSVFAQLDPRPRTITTLGDLDKIMKAEAGDDPSIIRLKVESQSPIDAARIANIWAEVFTVRANQIYGTQDRNQLQSFETQAASAEKTLQADEQALVEYQAHDRSLILENQLESTKQKQVDYLTNQRSITYLLRDIAGLREQLSNQPAAKPAGLADHLTALFLQIKAYQAQTEVPIQLQLNGSDTLLSANVSEQIAFLDGLSSSLKAQQTDIDTRLKEVEPQILALQQQLQQFSGDKDRLTRARDVARQTSLTLAQKVEETRIAVQATKGEVQLASHAAVPEDPIGPRKAVNTALGGVMGLILGVVIVLMVERRRDSKAGQRKIQEASA